MEAGFFKGAKGGIRLCEGTHQIVMSFLPPAVCFVLKKWFTKGGVTGTPGVSQAPQDPPSYDPELFKVTVNTLMHFPEVMI